jgi:hypothetical protein
VSAFVIEVFGVSTNVYQIALSVSGTVESSRRFQMGRESRTILLIFNSNEGRKAFLKAPAGVKIFQNVPPPCLLLMDRPLETKKLTVDSIHSASFPPLCVPGTDRTTLDDKISLLFQKSLFPAHSPRVFDWISSDAFSRSQVWTVKVQFQPTRMEARA